MRFTDAFNAFWICGVWLLVLKYFYLIFERAFFCFVVSILIVLASKSDALSHELKMREFNFGEISISIPSEWYVHDELSIQSIINQTEARYGNKINSTQKRLLVVNDRKQHPRAIVRLSALPMDKGLISTIEEISRANLSDRYIWAQELSQEWKKAISVRKIYPMDVEWIGQSNIPAMLIHYDRSGSYDSNSIWYVRIYQFRGKYNNYLLTISYDRSDKKLSDILTKVKNSVSYP